jgi:hypothetical protein
MPTKRKEETREQKDETHDDLPEHLQKIILKQHHIYSNSQGKKTTIAVTKDFILDMMNQFDLRYQINTYRVDPFRNDQTIVSVVLTVFDKNDPENIAKQTQGIASIDKMPTKRKSSDSSYRTDDDRMASLGQMALTSALKNAVMRHLYITANDVELLIKHHGIKLGGSTSIAREVIDDVDEVEDMPLDLGEGFGSELEL